MSRLGREMVVLVRGMLLIRSGVWRGCCRRKVRRGREGVDEDGGVCVGFGSVVLGKLLKSDCFFFFVLAFWFAERRGQVSIPLNTQCLRVGGRNAKDILHSGCNFFL